MPSPSPFARSRPGAVAVLMLVLALAAERSGAPPAAGAAGVRDAGGRLAVLPAEAPLAAAEPDATPSGPATARPVALSAPAAATDPADLSPAVADTSPLPPVQYLALDVNGVALPLAFLDVAPPLSTGRTALLLHGRLAGDTAWAPTIAALGGAGFRVIVPDLPGVGRSGRPAAPLHPTEVALQLDLLLDSLGAHTVSVVAHGGGAAAALALAEGSARVRQLALARPEPGPPATLPVPTLVVDAGTGEPRLPALLLGFLDR